MNRNVRAAACVFCRLLDIVLSHFPGAGGVSEIRLLYRW